MITKVTDEQITEVQERLTRYNMVSGYAIWTHKAAHIIAQLKKERDAALRKQGKFARMIQKAKHFVDGGY